MNSPRVIKSCLYQFSYYNGRSFSSAATVAVSSSKLKNAAVSSHRVRLFEKEKERQKRLVTSVDKIRVEYNDKPDPCTLYMNKLMSTPYDCARHVSTVVGDRAVLAEVDGQLWDMHRPLEVDCTLKYLHFKEADPYYVNKAFWRSCSLMLGSVLESAFKKEHYIQLCSFPPPNVRTGSFVYDVDLGMEWKPKKNELFVLSAEMVKLSLQQLPFERLSVPMELAVEMFRDNVYKSKQIPNIAKNDNSNNVTLYRVGSFVDVSCGPMVAHTGQLGRVTVAAGHIIPGHGGRPMMRMQAVALPSGILVNHFSYSVLEDRARKLNDGRLPDYSFMTNKLS